MEREHLAAADEAFTSSSVREVVPVVELDGAPLGRADDLQRLMTAERIGRPLTLTVVREGDLRRLTVVPDELPG